ncbi:Hypothetical predicted protein [Octopus vulgaris]|uniref:Uncharacterized protein n=1 Tax=Octopus vulgaris TaxID=6645 RepID=A0AA36BAG9_OCTVU|nr:Hypothetical predicted protein [Octopus vulgaris]
MRTLGVAPSQYQPITSKQSRKFEKPLAQLHKEILTSFNIHSPDAKRLSQHFDTTKSKTKKQFSQNDKYTEKACAEKVNNAADRSRRQNGDRKGSWNVSRNTSVHDDKYTEKACAEKVKNGADISRRQGRGDIKDKRNVNWTNKYDTEPSTVLQRLLQTKTMAEKYFSSQTQQFYKTRAIQKLIDIFSESQQQPLFAKTTHPHIRNYQKVPAVLTPLFLYLMVCKIYLDEKVSLGMGDRNTMLLYDKIHYSLEVLTSNVSEELVSSPSTRMTFAKLKEKLNHLDDNFKMTLKTERESYYQLDLCYTSNIYRKVYLNRSPN